MRPRRLRLTQRSDIDPPIITPKNDEKAMVMVESGPACDMGMQRLSEKSVGSQFLVAQPGSDDEAK